MDRIQEMTIFAALAERTSLASVARHFGLSTATVTRALSRLEQRLGVLLVIRTTRSLRLTDAGGTLCDRLPPLAGRSRRS